MQQLTDSKHSSLTRISDRATAEHHSCFSNGMREQLCVLVLGKRLKSPSFKVSETEQQHRLSSETCAHAQKFNLVTRAACGLAKRGDTTVAKITESLVTAVARKAEPTTITRHQYSAPRGCHSSGKVANAAYLELSGEAFKRGVRKNLSMTFETLDEKFQSRYLHVSCTVTAAHCMQGGFPGAAFKKQKEEKIVAACTPLYMPCMV